MKRELIISLALALVLALATIMPSPAPAAEPVAFATSGTVSSITPGTVKPAGTSGRFVVIQRDIVGSMSGDIIGAYTFSYKANVELLTQAGNLHGTLTVGESTFNLNGKIAPLMLVPVGEYLLPKLNISGNWDLIEGAHGEGIFNAAVTFIPTPEGHVGTIIDSTFFLTGQWQQ